MYWRTRDRRTSSPGGNLNSNNHRTNSLFGNFSDEPPTALGTGFELALELGATPETPKAGTIDHRIDISTGDHIPKHVQQTHADRFLSLGVNDFHGPRDGQ